VIVLASTSPIRRQLLKQAGIAFKTARPPINEDTITATLKKAGASVRQVALNLAEGKAASVGQILPGAYVIGADQMLECEGKWLDKPADRDHARRQLQSLRGKTHRLVTAVVVSFEGKTLWSHVENADMTMREFSDSFLDGYFEAMPEDAIYSVGGYQLEGLGVQLFDKIAGDYFSILGLPLLPLLGALRQAGALTA
jgi:septum formation protein